MSNPLQLVSKRIRGALIKRFRSLVYPEIRYNSYAQCGEDRILKFLLSDIGIQNPKYLDIGACHPSKGNNTYLFYLNGATGVCVEPNPEMSELIAKTRPNDTVLNIAVTPSVSGPMTFYTFEDPQLNTLVREEAMERTRTGKHTIKSEILVQTMTLVSIFDSYFPSGLDVLSIDVEGLDFAILNSVDWNRFRPKIVCVETVAYSETAHREKSNDCLNLLVSNGYQLYADTHVNSIFSDLRP